MAVYTTVSRDDIAELVTQYAIGDLIAFEGISAGVQNTNYWLETTEGKYIYTVYEPSTLGVDPAELPFFLGLVEHLAQHCIPCPLPIHTRAGEVIQEVQGKPSAITTFLEGKSPVSIQNHHCSELGHCLAKLHLASQDFSMTRDNAMQPFKVWDRLFPEIKDKADTVRHDMVEELESGYRYLQENWPENLPSGVIHCDLFPDNAFFIDRQLSGILDFYFACNDMFAYDIAYCLNGWCFEHGTEFNITKAKHILRAYNQVRELSEDELEALPVLSAGAALRILLTRLYDWLNPNEDALVKPHDPMELYHKLRFHRQVKSHREYGL